MQDASRRHLAGLGEALDRFADDADLVEGWGRHLAHLLAGGGRLLVAGNGGSCALAQHLAAEVVGRYVEERRPLSALALGSDPSTLTALVNDYGATEMFARQVRAHGRAGDVVLLLTTSGRSANLVAAATAARALGLTTWAMTGPVPNPVASLCDAVLAVDAPSTANVQEVHQVAVHLLCGALDSELGVPIVPGGSG